MKVLIVDDELSGREVLRELLLRFCPQVQILALCQSIAEAKEQIEKETPDVLFLDIEMPEENGFRLFSYFPEPSFQVVFTTAHEHYAIQAFSFSALDYLLKPIHYKKLQELIKRAEQGLQARKLQERLALLQEQLLNPLRKLAIPSLQGYVFASIEDIVRIEADANYSKIYLHKKEPFLSSKTLKEYEDLLSAFHFSRIHRSHLVNLNFIQEYQRGKSSLLIMEDGSELPIAANRKEQFIESLKRL